MPIFIDTDFTNFKDAELVIIGMMSECGQYEFYAELPVNQSKCIDFVLATILPQLGKVSEVRCTVDELQGCLRQWLEQSPSKRQSSVLISTATGGCSVMRWITKSPLGCAARIFTSISMRLRCRCTRSRSRRRPWRNEAMRMNAKDVAWMKGEATYELGDMVQAASRFAARRVLAIASLHVSALFKSDISTLSELIKRIARVLP